MDRGAVGLDLDHVGEQTGADPGGEQTRDLLAVSGGGHQNCCRTC